MSTRATYEFRDVHEGFTVYKHHDGYPRYGLRHIEKALEWAWPLPRFEAAEFAAAFVAANKTDPGGVYLTTGRDAHGDTEYHYTVVLRDGVLFVRIYRFGEPLDEGTLTDLLTKYPA